jgi:uncharacterized membrane protein
MGSVVKQDTINIKNNESAKFTILFWNIENISYNVDLKVKDAPQDWFVTIQPKKFLLDSSTGDEYIILPYLDKNVRAFAVNVLAKPENVKPGRYNISIFAIAGSPTDGVSFFQTREFKLTVNVNALQFIQQNETKIANLTEETRTLTGNFAKSFPQTSVNYIFYVIVASCIFVVSFLIYKYA